MLPRGWIAFKFPDALDFEAIFSGSWHCEGLGLLLKWWTPLFDPRTKRYDPMPIWVKLPNLPFEFWSLDFFKLVRNTLGSFLEADLSFLQSGVCCLGKVLVLIDLWNGLVVDLKIKRGNLCFSQVLDYVGVPFRCVRCHGHGHLVSQCSRAFQHKSGRDLKHNVVWQVKKYVGSEASKPVVLVGRERSGFVLDVSDTQDVLGMDVDPILSLAVKDGVSDVITSGEFLGSEMPITSDSQLDLGLDSEEFFLSIDALKSLNLTDSDSISGDHPGCTISNPVGSLSLGVLSEEFLLPVSSMGGLGFLSPAKDKKSRENGYFLRSCSKAKVILDGVKADVPGYVGHKSFCQDFGGHPSVAEFGVFWDHLSRALKAMPARSRFLP